MRHGRDLTVSCGPRTGPRRSQGLSVLNSIATAHSSTVRIRWHTKRAKGRRVTAERVAHRTQVAPDGQASNACLHRVKSLRSLGLPAVISPVKALVVELSVDPDPVGLVDPPAVPAGRTLRKGTGDLDPPSLFLCDCSNLLGNLREILILAHDERHVVFATMSKRNHVERDSHVMRRMGLIFSAIWGSNFCITEDAFYISPQGNPGRDPAHSPVAGATDGWRPPPPPWDNRTKIRDRQPWETTGSAKVWYASPRTDSLNLAGVGDNLTSPPEGECRGVEVSRAHPVGFLGLSGLDLRV